MARAFHIRKYRIKCSKRTMGKVTSFLSTSCAILFVLVLLLFVSFFLFKNNSEKKSLRETIRWRKQNKSEQVPCVDVTEFKGTVFLSIYILYIYVVKHT